MIRDKEEAFLDFKETLSIDKDSPFLKIAKKAITQTPSREESWRRVASGNQSRVEANITRSQLTHAQVS